MKCKGDTFSVEARKAGRPYIHVFAPVGRDAAMLVSMLRSGGLNAMEERDIEGLCDGLDNCMTTVLTAEALTGSNLRTLEVALRDQPPWSDLPVILLAGRDYPELETAVRTISNVTVIQRPVSQAFLLSVVQSAVRARCRQYEVRDLLETSARQQADIAALNVRLKTAMRETHHRVKNNLQVITALMSMQRIEYGDVVPAPELDRLMHHIRALAAIHDVLTQQARCDQVSAIVPVQEITAHLIPAYQAMLTDRREIKADIVNLILPVRHATSFALVLNELVSNAIKHGKRFIEVQLSVTDKQAELLVQDGGPGFSEEFDAEQSAHTGLELVVSLARWDLHGNIRFGNQPAGGGRVAVTFPVPALDQAPNDR